MSCAGLSSSSAWGSVGEPPVGLLAPGLGKGEFSGLLGLEFSMLSCTRLLDLCVVL